MNVIGPKSAPQEGSELDDSRRDETGVDRVEQELSLEAKAQRKTTEAAALTRATASQTDAVKADFELSRGTQENPASASSGAAVQEMGKNTWWGILIGGISVAANKVKDVFGTLGKSISDGLARLFGKAENATQGVKAIYQLSELLAPDAPVFSFLASKAPRVTSPFGRRAAPDDPGHHEDHNGIDITLAPGDEDIGEPIIATKPLIVKGVSRSQSGANQIVLQDKDHTEITYGFAHLDELPNLIAGTVLEPGALIGKIGNTGRSTGAHLHFTVRENGQVVDPAGYTGLA